MLSFKSIFIAVIVTTGLGFAAKTYADYQIARTFLGCVQELDADGRLKNSRNNDERRQYLVQAIDCTDQRLGFPASLLFDKQEAIANIEIKD